MRMIAIAALCACSAPPHPTSGGTTAAPNVLSFSVVTVGRHAGEGEVRISGAERHSHFTFNDRGRGPDVTGTITLDASGAPIAYRATGHDYLKAPVDEQLERVGDELVWHSTSEKGKAPAGSGWYVPMQGPLDTDALMVQSLLRAKDHRMKVLPAGEVWIDDDATLEVKVAGTPRKLRRVAIAGIGFSPGLVWLDEHDEYFGEVSAWTSVIRAGAEDAIDAMVKLDEAWNAARSAKLAHELAHKPPAAGLAIVHARLFDAETKAIVPDATVIVVGDKIAAVGDAKTPVPQGARVIDAGGRTLLPGLWDMHVHIGDTDGTLMLATGVTTVRDLGNDIDTLAARMQRFTTGTELGPNLLRAGLIDGKSEFAAPTGILVDNRDEAIAAVDRFAKLGYQQIKIYSSVKPELVPVIAEAAHGKHLRVSGHIPSGMNAAEAVEKGYDEIQHVNFLFLRFLAGPTDDTRTPLRFTRVAEQAADLDLNGKDVQGFLDLLVAHKTVLDPTLATFHAMFVSNPGDLDPVLAPYADRLPAQVVRFGKNGGLPAEGAKREKFRASYAALLKLIKLAWDRHIRIVAGTDDYAGLTLPHELELYVQAGIPAPEVLSLASLGAARVMGVDREAGSIAVGKRADLLLVAGDPTHDISTVRNADAVVCRGVVYDPDELFKAVGMRPRRK